MIKLYKNKSNLYIIKRHSSKYMLLIAGQTAGPIGLKFFVDTHGLRVLKAINNSKLFFQNYFYHGNAGPFS